MPSSEPSKRRRPTPTPRTLPCDACPSSPPPNVLPSVHRRHRPATTCTENEAGSLRCAAASASSSPERRRARSRSTDGKPAPRGAVRDRGGCLSTEAAAAAGGDDFAPGAAMLPPSIADELLQLVEGKRTLTSLGDCTVTSFLYVYATLMANVYFHANLLFLL